VPRAAAREGPTVYNVGATEFGTMRDTAGARRPRRHRLAGSIPARGAGGGGDERARHAGRGALSLRTTGCSTASLCGST
jgi:hypothetical protein